MLAKGEYARLKNYERKSKATTYNLCRFWKYSSVSR